MLPRALGAATDLCHGVVEPAEPKDYGARGPQVRKFHYQIRLESGLTVRTA
jgi:hypothetical protein